MQSLDSQPRPSARPAAASVARAPIDLFHLRRMTVGDRRLEREILDLFERQIGLLVDRMRDAEPVGLAVLAHTVKGSARSIGAGELAEAAEKIELSIERGGDGAAGLRAVVAARKRVSAAVARMRQNEAGADADL